MTAEQEKIVRISEEENVKVTESYDKVSGRWELNFYHLDTGKHWFTQPL